MKPLPSYSCITKRKIYSHSQIPPLSPQNLLCVVVLFATVSVIDRTFHSRATQLVHLMPDSEVSVLPHVARVCMDNV